MIFAFWRAELCLVGAYLFGGVTLAQFQAQALGATHARILLRELLPNVMLPLAAAQDAS